MGKYEKKDKKNTEVHNGYTEIYFISGLLGMLLRCRGMRCKCVGEPRTSPNSYGYFSTAH